MQCFKKEGSKCIFINIDGVKSNFLKIKDFILIPQCLKFSETEYSNSRPQH